MVKNMVNNFDIFKKENAILFLKTKSSNRKQIWFIQIPKANAFYLYTKSTMVDFVCKT